MPQIDYGFKDRNLEFSNQPDFYNKTILSP